MPLFSSIQELKTVVGGGANVSLQIDSLKPIMDTTAQEHIIPWISQELWDEVVEQFTADPQTLSATNTTLLPYIQACLGHLLMYEYMHIGNIHITDSGAHRMENEQMKSAYKAQENQYKKWMLEKGYEALERLLLFLHDNKADYPLWTASDGYTKHLSLVINYARVFRTIADHKLTRYTFEILRTIILDVETFALIPHMGQTQYDDIKTKIAADTALDATETGLLTLMQKIVAEFTIQEAVQRNLVRIDGFTVVQSESLEPQSYNKTTSPGNSATSLKIRHHDAFANRYVNRMLNYLEDNRETLTLYDTWKTTQEEAAAAAAETVICEEDQDRPYDLTRCRCGDECCSCGQSSGRSVIRL